MKTYENQAKLTAKRALHSFVRTLKLDPKYVRYFRGGILKSAELMIRTVRKHEPFRFNFAYLYQAVGYRLPYRWQRWFFNTFHSQGYDTHIMSRKIMALQKLTQALESGEYQQVVFLGSGYDPQPCLSSGQYPNVQFFEVNKGNIRKIKRDAYTQIRGEPIVSNRQCLTFGNNFKMIECDFIKESLHRKLLDNSFNPKLRTLVFVEELSAYLPKPVLDKIMGTMSGILSADSEMVVSLVDYESPSDAEKNGFTVFSKFTATSTMVLETDKIAKQKLQDPMNTFVPYYFMRKRGKSAPVTSLDAVPEYGINLAANYILGPNHH